MKSRALFLFALVALVLTFVARTAAADTQVTSTVDAAEVEVGETVTLTMIAQAEGETLSDPQPGAHAGMTVLDSSASPTQMVTIINGRRSDKVGLTVRWVMRADKVGSVTLGPPSVATGSGRKSALPQRVVVVARGSSTRPRRNSGPSTIDPFKGLFPGFPGFDDDEPDPFAGRQVVTADPSLSLAEPRAPVAFLHATVDKTRAVVGEQVTLNVYLYEDPHARSGTPSDVHEATANDFIKRSLLQDETRAIGLGNAMVGGRPWSVKLVRRNALFPLKTGRLPIQPMSLTLPQARVGLRESEILNVDVTEPPAANRPAGYQVGDVGDFSLSATVTPRTITQGGAVGVMLELRGTGNMPEKLPVPVLPGVEWLEPQVKDTLGAQQNDRFGGTRTFSYVVRINKSGAVDLGEVRLPYFDPATRTYALAKAGIGIIDVTPGSLRDAGADTVEEVLPGLPKERRVLEGPHHESFLTERKELWFALFGAPLACALVIGASGFVKRSREKRAAAEPSKAKLASDRRAEAEAALKGDDGKKAVSAVARSLEASVLADTNVNVRGTAGDNAVRELTDAGIADDAAREIIAVLRACEDARFSPDGVSVDTAHDLWKRATSVMSQVRA